MSSATAYAEYNEKILRCEMVLKVDGLMLNGPLPSDAIDVYITLIDNNGDFYLKYRSIEMNTAATFPLEQNDIFFTFASVVNDALLPPNLKNKNYQIRGNLNRFTLKFTTYPEWKDGLLEEFSGNCYLQGKPKI